MKYQPPKYIMDFLTAVYPGAEEIALDSFSEKTALIDATQTIIGLRADLEAAKAERTRDALIKIYLEKLDAIAEGREP